MIYGFDVELEGLGRCFVFCNFGCFFGGGGQVGWGLLLFIYQFCFFDGCVVNEISN